MVASTTVMDIFGFYAQIKLILLLPYCVPNELLTNWFVESYFKRFILAFYLT